MTRKIWLFGCIACAALLGCSDGDNGAMGEPGPAGPEGPGGPTGPVGDAPYLSSLSPSWGSAFTHVTLVGENFSATVEDNQVTFDGYPAEVLSASETELVVRAAGAVDVAELVTVNVEVTDRVSNGLIFELVPSGTARTWHETLPTEPTDMTVLGGALYVAAGAGAIASAGLYRQDADGMVRRIWTGGERELDGTIIYDGPIALARNSGNLYFTSALGSVYKLDPDTDQVTQIATSPVTDMTEFPSARGLVVDGDDIFVLHKSDNTLYSFIGDTVVTLAVPASAEKLAGDSDNLYYTDSTADTVVRVADPGGAQTVTAGFVTGVDEATGLAIDGADLVISTSTGLATAPVATGGAATDTGDDSLGSAPSVAASGGDRYYALGGMISQIHRVADGETAVETVAAGSDIYSFGLVETGGLLYWSHWSLDGPYSHVLELHPDGASRLVVADDYILDIAVGDAGELIAARALDAEVISIDIASGDTTVLADAGDGVGTPTGVHATSNGTIFYYDLDAGSIGRISSTGTVTPGFVDMSGAPPDVNIYTLNGTDDELVVSSFTSSSANGFVATISTATGAINPLSPPGVPGAVSAVGSGVDGRLFAAIYGTGAIFEVDPDSGEMIPLGQAAAATTAGEMVPLAIHGKEDGTVQVYVAYETDVSPIGLASHIVNVAP